MTRTQIYLPENQIAELKRAAAKEETSVSELIRHLINNGLKGPREPARDPKKTTSQWLLSLAKEAEKSTWKGPKDLSTNMDSYLYGK